MVLTVYFNFRIQEYGKCLVVPKFSTITVTGFSIPFQWHRTTNTQETDGFQVKRPGDQNVRCTVLLMLDYQVRHVLRKNDCATRIGATKVLISCIICGLLSNFVVCFQYEPCCEKTGLRGFRPGLTQTGRYGHRR